MKNSGRNKDFTAIIEMPTKWLETTTNCSAYCPVLCLHVFIISWQPWQFWPKYGNHSGKMRWNIGLMTTFRVGCWCENPPQEMRVGNSLVLKHLLNTAHWPSTSLPSFNVFRKNIAQVCTSHVWVRQKITTQLNLKVNNDDLNLIQWKLNLGPRSYIPGYPKISVWSVYQTKHLWIEARLTLANEAPQYSCVLVV